MIYCQYELTMICPQGGQGSRYSGIKSCSSGWYGNKSLHSSLSTYNNVSTHYGLFHRVSLEKLYIAVHISMWCLVWYTNQIFLLRTAFTIFLNEYLQSYKCFYICWGLYNHLFPQTDLGHKQKRKAYWWPLGGWESLKRKTTLSMDNRACLYLHLNLFILSIEKLILMSSPHGLTHWPLGKYHSIVR